MQAGDILCMSEHRWLGTDAYRIGVALLSRDRLNEACDVLSLSTEELTVWVGAGGSDKDATSRANEVCAYHCTVEYYTPNVLMKWGCISLYSRILYP